MNQCKECDKETKNKFFCCKTCASISHGREKSSILRKEVKCCKCRKLFTVKPSKIKDKNYCSNKCYWSAEKACKKERIIKMCATCNKNFETIINSPQIYCSYECTRLIRECKHCKKTFTTNRHGGNQDFCNEVCHSEYKRIELNKHCLNCGKLLYRRRNYCSKECMGNGYAKTMKGNINPNFGNGEKVKQHWKDGKYDKVMTCQKHSYAKGGYYGEQWMRSSWELKYAEYLDKKGIKWEYETKWFIFKNGLRYLPDFYLPELNEWHEVKGWMDEKSKTKIALFISEFPNEKLVIIDKEVWKNE